MCSSLSVKVGVFFADFLVLMATQSHSGPGFHGIAGPFLYTPLPHMACMHACSFAWWRGPLALLEKHNFGPPLIPSWV